MWSQEEKKGYEQSSTRHDQTSLEKKGMGGRELESTVRNERTMKEPGYMRANRGDLAITTQRLSSPWWQQKNADNIYNIRRQIIMTHVTVIGKYAANRALLIKFVTGSFVPANYPNNRFTKLVCDAASIAKLSDATIILIPVLVQRSLLFVKDAEIVACHYF